MHLNGKIVKMLFEGKQYGNGHIDRRFMILKKNGPKGLVCPHLGEIYMYTVIFKDL